MSLEEKPALRFVAEAKLLRQRSTSLSDDDDSRAAGLAQRTDRLVGAVSVVASVVVVGAFLFALGVSQPSEGVHVIVVADPRADVGDRTPVRVLALHRHRLVPVRAAVNGAGVDVDGFGTAVVENDGLHVTGTAQLASETRAIDLTITAPAPTTTTLTLTTLTLTTSPWLTALAMPVAGAAVYPQAGQVPSRGPSSVVLVDDNGVEIVEVDPTVDARLPDGRLVAVDRRATRLRFANDVNVSDNINVVIAAREASSVVISVVVVGVVGAHVEAMARVDLVVGDNPWRHSLSTNDNVGDLVVVTLSSSLLPSAASRQIVTRIGGLRDDDLLRVEPRAAGHLDKGVVRQALASRLVVDAAAPTVVSPPYAAQEAAWRRQGADEAASARRVFRGAALAQLLCLLIVAIAARPRPLAAALALALVAGLDGGLDTVLGVPAVEVDGAISGSP